MIRPLGNRVVVRQIDPTEVTAGGVILPDIAQEKHHRGVVVAIGEGHRAEMTGRVTPPDVQVGDEVLFSKYGGTDVEVDGHRLLIIRCDDLIGVVGELEDGGEAPDEA